MRNLCCFCILALALMVCPYRVDADPNPDPQLVARPVPETEQIVIRWLKMNGLQLTGKAEKPFERTLEIQGQNQLWHIALAPHSPLATDVTVSPGQAADESLLSDFRQYLGSFGLAAAPITTFHEGEIPSVVQAQMDAVVCINYERREGPVKLSGFVIDTKGVIATTAHDLQLGAPVSVALASGRSLTGIVSKLDPEQDLCLIQVPEALGATISVRDGRFMPGKTDVLFALGCNGTGPERIRQGILDGPPRRVHGRYLLQVKMNVEHGSSGSPVLDEQGRLTAIVEGRFRGSNSVGFLIPFETLLQFLEKY